MVENYDRAELKKVELVNEDNSYYLDVTYEYENKYGIYELNIPRILLPMCKNMLPGCIVDMPRYYGPNKMFVDLGFGEFEVLKDTETGMTHRITEIEKKQKPRKMTLAEIEKVLGHTVELISE